MEQQPQNPLNEAVERDVRLLIGDLHMQLIVMRAMMNQQQQGQIPRGDVNAPRQSAATQSDVRSSTGKVNSGNSQEGGEGIRIR